MPCVKLAYNAPRVFHSRIRCSLTNLYQETRSNHECWRRERRRLGALYVAHSESTVRAAGIGRHFTSRQSFENAREPRTHEYVIVRAPSKTKSTDTWEARAKNTYSWAHDSAALSNTACFVHFLPKTTIRKSMLGTLHIKCTTFSPLAPSVLVHISALFCFGGRVHNHCFVHFLPKQLCEQADFHHICEYAPTLFCCVAPSVLATILVQAF